MRVTNNMLSQNLLRNLDSARGRMNELQNQLASGHSITKPSDDPVGIQNALRIKSNLSATEQWKINADEALVYMNTADSLTGEIVSMLQRVRELIVQGSNGTLGPSQREDIAEEIYQLKEQIGVMANTQIGNRYLFAGTKTDVQPYSGTWQGNGEDVKFEVGNNLSVPVSVNGQTLFDSPPSGVNGIFTTLDNLISALRNNDMSQIQAAFGDVDGNIDNVITHRASLGARINRMTALRSQLDITALNLQANLSEIRDADMAQTIVDFKNQENVYRAALSIGSKIIQPSLVDFMS